MREAYRLRKHELYELLGLKDKKIVFMLVYIAKEKVEYKQLESAMNKVIGKFGKCLSE
jgi:ribonuclease P protein component